MYNPDESEGFSSPRFLYIYPFWYVKGVFIKEYRIYPSYPSLSSGLNTVNLRHIPIISRYTLFRCILVKDEFCHPSQNSQLNVIYHKFRGHFWPCEGLFSRVLHYPSLSSGLHATIHKQARMDIKRQR